MNTLNDKSETPSRMPWVVGGTAIALVAAVWWLAAIFAPLIVGLVLALVLAPAVDRLAKLVGSRGRAAGLLIGAIALFFGVVALVAGPALVQEGRHWVATAQGEGTAAFAKTAETVVDYTAWADPNSETWDAAQLAGAAEKRGAPAEVVRALRSAVPQNSKDDLHLAAALGDSDGDGRLEPGYGKRWKQLTRDRKGWPGRIVVWLDRSGISKQAEHAMQKALSREQLGKLLDEDALSTAGGIGLRVLGSVRNAVMTALTVAVGAALVPIYAFFFLLALPQWSARLPEYLPVASRGQWLRILQRVGGAVVGFVRGRLVVCSIVALITAIGWLALGVRLALLMGLAVGALTVVPLANVVALVPTLLICLLDVAADQHSWGWLLAVLAVFAVGQVADSVLNPIVVGDAVQLDMVTIIVAFFVGAAVAGFVGLLVAVPVAATLRILAEELLLPRWRAWANPATAAPADDVVPP